MRWLLVSLLALAALVPAAGAATPDPVQLPGDHGSHPQFSVEWWYTTGHAHTSSGRQYFWFATIWQSPLIGAVGRVNVVDLDRDRVVLSREFSRPDTFPAGARDFRVGGVRIRWQPQGDAGFGRLRVTASRLRLIAVPRRPYALHGDGGIVRQGPGATSAYYSSTRARMKGRLGARRLSGMAWFDHQYGDFVSVPGALRWDWFACQFGTGELMVMQFLDASDKPVLRYGTIVDMNGTTHVDDFTATPVGRTLHPAGATGTYPLGWRLQVPTAGLDVRLRAAATHQFIRMKTLPSFYEGAFDIVGAESGACTVENSREAPAAVT